MLPAFGLWEKVERPMLNCPCFCCTNCLMTRLAAPILLLGESASPSHAELVPASGCSVVCELPKMIIRFGGTEDFDFRRSLSSAAIGPAARSAARARVVLTLRIAP